MFRIVCQMTAKQVWWLNMYHRHALSFRGYQNKNRLKTNAASQ